MCGVTGIFSLSGRPIQNAEDRISRMTSMLVHRGPDSHGVYVSNDKLIALGNTRLAIVDPLNKIKGPLETKDGKFILSFNGEIYNYLDLRKMLQCKGIAFRTLTDTEVLLEGLRLEGEKFLQKLDGMWAFAYYDKDKRRLLLSRDILGERHIFYRIDKDEFIFASEVKPLLMDSDCSFEVDFESFLTSLQYFSAPPGRTMVKGIHRMFPGHNMLAEVEGEGIIRQYRYRRLHPEKWFDFFNKEPSLDAVIEIFEKTFYSTCKRRLPKEVPYICTLSGGLDSALICLYSSDFGKVKIRTLYGQSAEKPAQNLKSELDEYSASKLTSRKLNTEHDHMHIDSEDCIPILRNLADNAFDGMYDSTVASFAMLANYVKKQNLKVMLISEGPDEFLGYPKDLNAYKIDHLFIKNKIKFRALKIISSTKFSRQLLQRIGLNNLVIPSLFSYDPFRFIPIHESWGSDILEDLLSQNQIADTSNHYGVMDPAYNDLKSKMDYGQLRALSYASLSLPDMFNLRTDKAYMSASVEARLPFQAPEIVELMVAAPSIFRFNNGKTTKHLLREIVKRNIDPEIAYRSKHGFSSPIWLSPNIYKSMPYEEVIRASSIFEDFSFNHGAREFVLKPENKDMLWPFFVLAKTYDNLKKRNYQ